MGWAGQAGWGSSHLFLYMTVLSFIIGGFLRLVAVFPRLEHRQCLEPKVIFLDFRQGASIFRAVPFIILLAIMALSRSSRLSGHHSPLVRFLLRSCLCPSGAGGLGWIGWWCPVRRLKRRATSGTSWVFTYQKVFQI